jgi:hypothetical protein
MTYHVVGQDDYMLEIQVEPSGAYRIDTGDHTSHEPRKGQLDAQQTREIAALVAALGPPRDHPGPEGATGFVAQLTIGDPSQTRVYRVWEGAMSEEPDLEALVRALEVI